MSDKPLDQAAIDALLRGKRKTGRGNARSAGDSLPPPPTPAEPPAPEPAGPDPAPAAASRTAAGSGIYATVSQVPVEIAVVLGDLEMPIAEVLKLQPGSIVQLQALADAPVEIRLRGRTIARAQVVVLEDSYGLRIVENLVAAPDFPPAPPR